MVKSFLTPLGPRLVEACERHRRRPGARRRRRHRQRVVAGGGPRRPGHRQRPHPGAAGRRAAPRGGGRAGAGVGRGRRRAPAVRRRLVRRRDVRDRRHVRPAPPADRGRARPGLPARRAGRPALLDAGGHDRRAVRDDEAVLPPPPPGAQPPPLWGSEEHLRALFGGRVEWADVGPGDPGGDRVPRRDEYARHFTGSYGPTIAARANAVRNGREQELDAALDAFFAEWDRGTAGAARYELEYLLAVGTDADRTGAPHRGRSVGGSPDGGPRRGRAAADRGGRRSSGRTGSPPARRTRLRSTRGLRRRARRAGRGAVDARPGRGGGRAAGAGLRRARPGRAV